MKRRDVIVRGLALAAILSGLVAPLKDVRAADAPAGLDPATGLFLDDRVLGNPNAKAVLIEYASLSCPHCASFNNTIMPKLRAEWIDTGKLLYVYRHFPLNAPALWAAMAAECRQGESFFGFIDMLYQQQPKWLTADDPKVALFEIAQLAGFDQAVFDQCLNDDAMLNKILDRIDYASATYDIKGTPTIILNGQIVDADEYDALSDAISDIVH